MWPFRSKAITQLPAGKALEEYTDDDYDNLSRLRFKFKNFIAPNSTVAELLAAIKEVGYFREVAKHEPNDRLRAALTKRIDYLEKNANAYLNGHRLNSALTSSSIIKIEPKVEKMNPMSTAPQTAKEVILIYPRTSTGNQARIVAHWASDLSGEEQPPFRGWYRATVGDGGSIHGYYEVPKGAIGWLPMPEDTEV